MNKHPCDVSGTPHFVSDGHDASSCLRPDYEGPDYRDLFKESPFGMPTSEKVLARPMILPNRQQCQFLWPLVAAMGHGVALLGEKPNGPEPWYLLPKVDAELFDLENDIAVAKTLLDRGYYYLVVNRTLPIVRPWLDGETSSLKKRLRDGHPAACFHPIHIGEELVIYKISSNFVCTPVQIAALFKFIRGLLAGNEVALDVSSWRQIAAMADGEQRLIIGVRQGSKRLIKRMGHGSTWPEAIQNAVRRLKEGWQKEWQLSLCQIEVDLCYDLCQIDERRIGHIWPYVELGLHGLLVQKGGESHYIEPSLAVTAAIPSASQLLEQLCLRTNLPELLRPSKEGAKHKRRQVLNESKWLNSGSTYPLFRFNSYHYLENSDHKKILALYRAVPRIKIEDVSRDSLLDSLRIGADWLVNNQLADGQFAYRYDPIAPKGYRWLEGNNIVRHALNPYNLLTVYGLTKEERFLESARRGLEYSFKQIQYFEGRALVVHQDAPAPYPNAKLGTAVVLILSLLKMRDITGDKQHDQLIKELAKEVLYLQDKNGHFNSYDVPPGHPYYRADNMIVPGEALFALARLAITFGPEDYQEAIDKTIDYYMAAWRYRLNLRSPEGIYNERNRVDLVSLVPWMVTAFDHLHRLTGKALYVKLAFEMEDWLEDEFYFSQDRSPYLDYLGSSFKSHYELPAINACQYAEGAAHAYELAARTGDESAPRRRVRLIEMMRFCLQLQYRDFGSTYFLPEPAAAMGGYRYTLGHLHLRSDYSYHAMAAIAQAVESLWK